MDLDTSSVSQKDITIAICDDHKIIVEAFTDNIEITDGFAVSFTCGSLQELRSQLKKLEKKHLPDILLLDGLLSDGMGTVAIPQLKKVYPSMKVMLITGKNVSLVKLAQFYDADGFFSKEWSRKDLHRGIMSIIAEETPFWTMPILNHFLEQPPQDDMQEDIGEPHSAMTNMELRVLSLIHLSNSDIGKELNISSGTVRNYISSIYKKLKTKERSVAHEYAQKIGYSLFDSNHLPFTTTEIPSSLDKKTQ
jgi:DNA-binding NarL/FixJ family response regulator